MLVIGGNEEFNSALQLAEGVVCIGAGKRKDQIQEIIGRNSILDEIDFFVDNSIAKQMSGIEIADRPFCVYSFEKANEKLKGKNVVILITNLRYEDLIIQMENFDNLKDKKVFCLEFIKALKQEESDLQKEIPKSIKLLSEPIIPKKIHYCWVGGNSIPERNRKWMESWKKYCPDYEIIEWNESNYDFHKVKYMHQAYEAKKWGFVPDYARLEIIYNCGGIYLDTDVELISNLDDLLYQDAYAAFEKTQFVNLGTGFGACKGSKIIKAMMDEYENLEFINPDGSLNLVASPEIQTKTLLRHGLKQNGEYQRLDGITIFPEKMLNGKCSSTRRVRIREFTKSIHHYDASWQSDEFKKAMYRLEKDMNAEGN